MDEASANRPTWRDTRTPAPWKCGDCGKGFNYPSQLETHQRTHTGEDLFTCSVCGKGFTTSLNLLTQHRVHTGEGLFTCSVCGKGFSLLYNMLRHQGVHNLISLFVGMNTPNQITCLSTSEFTLTRVCLNVLTGNFCQSSEELIKHQGVHTVERPFTCSLCGKGFTNSSSLTAHQLVHSNTRPFKCSGCEKSFKSRKHLMQHQRTHRGEDVYLIRVWEGIHLVIHPHCTSTCSH